MGPGNYCLLYRDLEALRWLKSGKLWQRWREENHELMPIF